MGKQDRKGGGDRQGPAEGSPNLIPLGALEGQAHPRIAPPGGQEAGLAHSCTSQVSTKGFGVHSGVSGGRHQPHALLDLSTCGERSPWNLEQSCRRQLQVPVWENKHT